MNNLLQIASSCIKTHYILHQGPPCSEIHELAQSLCSSFRWQIFHVRSCCMLDQFIDKASTHLVRLDTVVSSSLGYLDLAFKAGPWFIQVQIMICKELLPHLCKIVHEIHRCAAAISPSLVGRSQKLAASLIRLRMDQATENSTQQRNKHRLATWRRKDIIRVAVDLLLLPAFTRTFVSCDQC